MIQKREKAKQLLAKAGLGSLLLPSSTKMTRPKKDSKLYLEESSIPDGNESTTIGKNVSSETLFIGGSPGMFTMLQSSRSSHKGGEISLPVLSVKNSARSNNGSSFLFSGVSPRMKNNSQMYSIIPTKVYDKLLVNRSVNFTTIAFIQHLKRLLPKTPGKDNNKMMAYLGGVRQSISITHAKKILTLLGDELNSIRKKTVYQSLGLPMLPEIQQLYNEQYTLIEDLDGAISDMYNISDRALAYMKTKRKFDLLIKDMAEIAAKSNNHELVLYCSSIQIKIAMARNDMNDAIKLLKKYKHQCKKFKEFQDKTFAYKNLGRCYQSIKKHKAALGYFTKFLQMAWYFNNEKQELLAYDLIGKQYFYMGETNKAAIFHSKMVTSSIEPQSSMLRKIGVYKIGLGKEQPGYNPQMFKAPVRSSSIREEDEDDSSRDEIINLPTPPPETEPDEEEIDVKEMSPEQRRRKIAKEKKKLAENNKEKLFKGLVRAELIKAKNERNLRFGNMVDKPPVDHGVNNKKDFDNKREESKQTSPSDGLKSKSKPADQILVSHLTRNRNYKSFANNPISSSRLTYESEQKPEDDVQVTEAAAEEKIKKILEKFRANLRLLKESLEICSLEDEINLLPMGEKSRSRLDNSSVLSKRSFLHSGVLLEF